MPKVVIFYMDGGVHFCKDNSLDKYVEHGVLRRSQSDLIPDVLLKQVHGLLKANVSPATDITLTHVTNWKQNTKIPWTDKMDAADVFMGYLKVEYETSSRNDRTPKQRDIQGALASISLFVSLYVLYSTVIK